MWNSLDSAPEFHFNYYTQKVKGPELASGGGEKQQLASGGEEKQQLTSGGEEKEQGEESTSGEQKQQEEPAAKG
jgi:hypothetical protein